MRSQSQATSIGSTRALQRLFALQEYSLARYAARAKLYGRHEANRSLTAIRSIANAQSIRAGQIGSLLAHRRESVGHYGFPLCFTGLNYVSADYVTRLLLIQQPQLIAEVSACLQSLLRDNEGRQAARAVLAGETANLDTLRSVAGDAKSRAGDLAIAA